MCLVPLCPNTSRNSPEKIFIRIPRNKVKREKWWIAGNIKIPISNNPELFCCEDHFEVSRVLLDTYM